MVFVAPFTAAVSAIAAAIKNIAAWWHAADNLVHLMKNNPNIDANTLVGSFTPADFTGYAALSPADSPRVWVDPLSGNFLIRFVTPESGWFWAPADAVGLPQTIYGAYITSADGTKLVGAVKFASPIILTAADQLIDLGDVVFSVTNTPLGG